MALICLTAACDENNSAKPDASADLSRGDAVRPPDFAIGDGGGSGNIGRPCDPKKGSGCTGKAICLKVSDSVGICAVPDCTPDDLSTPALEDNCPFTQVPGKGGSNRTICTRIPSLKKNFCLPSCTPSTSASNNTCASFHSKLTCAPLSLLYNKHNAVCLFERCQKDTDCGNKNPVTPDATCDKKSGTCLTKGKAGAKISDACQIDSDCGAGQNCYPEEKTGGKVRVEGGYCTVVGCHLGGPWACPGGSKCFFMGAKNVLSLCLATGCKPQNPPELDGCRDKASAGQYDCLHADKTDFCWLDPTGSGK